jgi:SWI/SNF-related matrix-associated actin-dependent regulator of chromatin subfamily A3
MDNIDLDNINEMKVTTALLPHQVSGKEWMTRMEEESNGGMLLDRPGMGKTLTVISLLCESPKPKTLVVSPAGVLAVWAHEFKKHSVGVRVVTLRGARGFPSLDSFDVLLASYQSLLPARSLVREEEEDAEGIEDSDITSDLCTNLFELKWDRVIFDESHYLKNLNSKTYKQALCLSAEKKWVVTATPVFNKLDELFAYMKLLDIEPYASDPSQWQKQVVKPIEESGATGFATLRNLMDKLSLRRAKEILNLPPRVETEVNLNLNPLENRLYWALFRYTKDRVESLTARMDKMEIKKKSDTGFRDDRKATIRGTVLRMILRLRYAAVSPDLALNSLTRLQRYGIMSVHKPDDRIRVACNILEWIVERDEQDNKSLGSECLSCLDDDYCYYVSGCGHRLCEKCVEKAEKKHDVPKCPYCYLVIPSLVTTVPSIPIPSIVKKEEEGGFEYFGSTKINYTLSSVKRCIDEGHGFIVVSEWTCMLDILEFFFIKERIPFLRIDGKVALSEREKRINDFQDNKVRVIMVSLCAVAEGVTLTAADRVIFMEPFWNEGKEEQAANRCHRIGQTREVKVFKLHMKGTIESGMFEMKAKKKEMSMSVVGDKTFSHSKATWINNIRLFMKDRKAEVKKRPAAPHRKVRSWKRGKDQDISEFAKERLL